jgi:molybdenum cofactor biosynthesis protein B
VVRCAVVTVSDTRTLQTDRGGQAIVDLLDGSGHATVVRQIVPDDPQLLRPLVQGLAARDDVDVILVTGGTGISPRDQTFETISALADRPLPGYGELFRLLSYQEIGPAAMLSRTVGGLMARTVVLTMPGSPSAVSLAMRRLILPELGHLVQQAGKTLG